MRQSDNLNWHHNISIPLSPSLSLQKENELFQGRSRLCNCPLWRDTHNGHYMRHSESMYQLIHTQQWEQVLSGWRNPCSNTHTHTLPHNMTSCSDNSTSGTITVRDQRGPCTWSQRGPTAWAPLPRDRWQQRSDLHSYRLLPANRASPALQEHLRPNITGGSVRLWKTTRLQLAF